ncbi:MAG TPA: PEP-CTERM sorting domain-containing protein [Leptolyngbyaceae cyanobacterium]
MIKARTLLPATLAACGLAFGSSFLAQAQAATFSLTPFTGSPAKIDISLDELIGGNIGVKVNVDKSVALADLRAVFFNVKNESILPQLTLIKPSTGVGTFKFAANSISEIGKVKFQGEPGLNPCTNGCDGGIEIGQDGLKGGSDDFQTASWTFTRKDGAPLTLADFEGMTWGVRATSVGPTGSNRGGSSKMSGSVPKGEKPRDIPEPTGSLALFVVAAGGLSLLRRKSTEPV